MCDSENGRQIILSQSALVLQAQFLGSSGHGGSPACSPCWLPGRALLLLDLVRAQLTHSLPTLALVR